MYALQVELPPLTPSQGRPGSRPRTASGGLPASSTSSPWSNDNPALRQLAGVSRRYYPVGFWQHRRGSLPDIEGQQKLPEYTRALPSNYRRPSFQRSYTNFSATGYDDDERPGSQSSNGSSAGLDPLFEENQSNRRNYVKGQHQGKSEKQATQKSSVTEKQRSFDKLPPLTSPRSASSVTSAMGLHKAGVLTSPSQTDTDNEKGFEAKIDADADKTSMSSNSQDNLIDNKSEGASSENAEPFDIVSEKVQAKVASPVDQEDTPQQELMKKVLGGDYIELPPAECNTVRIFLSSTFSDMKEERNRLACIAYPDLRQYCSERGLDFQVMDMRWGVTDDVTNDHSTNTLCMQQIELCRRLSAGPNFVALVGNRYGFRPFPTTISMDEFEMLRSLALDEEIPNVDLLDSWFSKDENALPNVYSLLPINSRIKFYADRDPANEEQRVAAHDLWNQTFCLMQKLFRETVATAVNQGKMSQERAEQYFTSVTENEINQGLLNRPNPMGLCFFRHLDNLTEDLGQRAVGKYIDLTSLGEKVDIDSEALSCLTKLKEEKIPNAVVEKHRRNFHVAWQEGGLVDTEYDDKERYLEELCKSFTNYVKELIDEGLKANKDLEKNALYRDVIHHARFCNAKVSTFCGREELLSGAELYLKNAKQSSQPLVLYGDSGIGKTSVMAMIAHHARDWLGQECKVILRFLGTSPATSDIKSTLLGVSEQICKIYDIDQPNLENLDSALKMNRYFQQLLVQVSQEYAAEKPLLLVLDSLDQLSPSDGAHGVIWVPVQLPQNVYLVLSTLPKEHGILDNLKQRLSSAQHDCFLEVQNLPAETGEEIVKHHLKQSNRTLTYGQMQLLLGAFRRCPQPLYLKILIDEALQCKSYTVITGDSFTSTAREAIMRLFLRLEAKYGQVLVSAIASYITVSKGGITEVELEDVLSCNNKVLDEVYQYHRPPMQGVVRIPPLLWARIRQEINEYLVEKQADGKTVVYWYHRQFIQAASMRYLLYRGPEDSSKRYSADLAEIFLAESGVKKTISFSKLAITVEDADRQIAPQPLSTSNIRKLRKLPLFLINSGSFDIIKDTLKERCLCNFNFLLTKLQGTSVHEVLQDFRRVQSPDDEMDLMQDFFLLSAAGLKKSPNELAMEIITRLPKECPQWPNVQKLIKEAWTWLRNKKYPMLLPKYPCRPSPGGLLKSTYQGFSKVLGVYGRGKGVMWGAEQGLEVWDFHTSEYLHHISVQNCTSNILLSDNSAYAFHVEGGKLIQSKVETGSQVCEIPLIPDFSGDIPQGSESSDSLFTILAISSDVHWTAIRINNVEIVQNSKSLLVVDIENRCVAQQLMDCSDKILVSGAAFTPGENYLVITTKTSQCSIIIWNCKEQKEVGQITLEKGMSIVHDKIRISPDGQYAAVGCRLDNTVVLHIETCEPYYFPDRSKEVTVYTRMADLQFLPENDILWLSYDAKKKESVIQILEFNNKVLVPLGSCDGMATSMTLSGDSSLVFVCTMVGMVNIWNIERKSKIQTLHAHTQVITGCVFVEFSKMLFTASSDDSVKMWKLNSLLKDSNEVFEKKSLKHSQRQSGKKSKGVRFVTGDKEDVLDDNNENIIYDGENDGKQDEMLPLDGSNNLQNQETDHTELSGEKPEESRTADLNSETEGIQDKHKDMSGEEEQSEKSDKVIEQETSSETDGDAKHALEANDESKITTSMQITAEETESLRSNINQMSLTPDGHHVITCYESRAPVIWRIASAQIIHQMEEPESTEGVPYILTHPPDSLFGLAKSNKGDESVDGNGKYKLVKWQLESGECVSRDVNFQCDLICITDDNKHLALYQRKEKDATVVILNPDTMEAVRTLQLPRSHPSERMLVSCDLQNIVLVQSRDNVVVYQVGLEKQVADSTECLTLRFRVIPESVLLYGDDLVMGNSSGFLFRCSLAELAHRMEEVTLKKVKLITGGASHSAQVWAIVPEKEDPCRMLATVSSDGSLFLVDMYRRDLMVELKGHQSGVSCAAFSPGGHLVASGSLDHTVRLWNVTDGEPITCLDVGDDVFDLDLSGDGNAVVALVHRYGARRMVIMDLENVPDMKQL